MPLVSFRELVELEGSTSGTSAEMFAYIFDDANWNTFSNATVGTTNFNGAVFSVTVPEPSAMSLLGLGALSLLIRKRRV